METTEAKRPLPVKRVRGGRDRARAARQRAYRERLAENAIPEADDIDAAVLGVIRSILAFANRKDREGRGHPSELAFAKRVAKGTVDALEAAGFDREVSKKLVAHRLGERRGPRPPGRPGSRPQRRLTAARVPL